jgi:uncharacterized protein YndB with AHSA1/START domain
MENLHFKIDIKASAEKVWKILWEDATYRQWTEVFAPGSRAESDWKKGSRVLFLDKDDNGTVSEIDALIPNEHISFKHLRSIKKGVELMDDPEDKIWTGSHEKYTLKNKDGITELDVLLESVGMTEKMFQYFEKTWPQALQTLKKLSEEA